MKFFKTNLKYFFLKTRSLFILDKINYLTAYFKNLSKNRKFKNLEPDFRIPPDYFLYETYKLNYNEYKEDGNITAKEIAEWTQQYLNKNNHILEWGCGVSRIIRHLPKYVDSNTKLFGADINEKMISWNKRNIDNIVFDKINYIPPTQYTDNYFNLVYAISVFTHIELRYQSEWMKEIHRIIKWGGISIHYTRY